jgi:hypothetical protein
MVNRAQSLSDLCAQPAELPVEDVLFVRDEMAIETRRFLICRSRRLRSHHEERTPNVRARVRCVSFSRHRL